MSLVPPDPFSNPEEWSDTECVLAGQNLRKDRLNTVNMTLTRMLKGLRRLGHENLTPEAYRNVERNPYGSLGLIRDGIIRDAYRVLTGDMPAFTNADEYTLAVVNTIEKHRELRHWTYRDLAAEISNRGEFITKDEYRTQEQGLTKNISVSVVIRAAQAFGIPLEDFFDQVAHALYGDGDGTV